jgi:hypothetical protein
MEGRIGTCLNTTLKKEVTVSEFLNPSREEDSQHERTTTKNFFEGTQEEDASRCGPKMMTTMMMAMLPFTR